MDSWRRPTFVALHVAGLVIVAATLVAVSTADQWRPIQLVIVLAVLTAASGRTTVRVRNIRLSGEHVMLVLAMALLGPAPAACIALASVLWWSTLDRPRPLLVLNNALTFATFPLVGGLLIDGMVERLDLVPESVDFALLVFVVFQLTNLLNFVLSVSALSLLGGLSWRRQFRTVWVPFMPLELMLGFLTAGLAVLYVETGLAALTLSVGLLLAFQYLVRELLRSQERASALEERGQQIVELAESRGRLVAQALDAEDRSRQALAITLHDGAVQSLLVAGQDLDEAAHGDPRGLPRARRAVRDALAELRGTIADLYPATLDHAGLQGALEAVAEQHGRRAAVGWTISVDADAEDVEDRLLFSLGRELMLNVIKHARASHARVTVTRARDALVLEVEDDGRGWDPETTKGNVAAGHIGLASARERIEARGGTLQISTGPLEGTLVAASIPTSPSAREPRDDEDAGVASLSE